MRSWTKAPWLSAQDAKAQIERLTEAIANESDPRKRIKLARRLAFAGISLAFVDDDLAIEDLERGIAALALARKRGAQVDDLNRAQAWLSKKRLDAAGGGDANILGEKKKMVAVEAACLAAAPDSADGGAFLTWPNADVLAAMNDGRFFNVHFQADGGYPVTLRWIDAAEPVLKRDEYKGLEASSEVGFLRIGSGELRFGAPEDLDEGAILKVPDGLARVRVFCLVKRGRPRVVLVACPTAEPPPPLTQLPEVEF